MCMAVGLLAGVGVGDNDGDESTQSRVKSGPADGPMCVTID